MGLTTRDKEQLLSLASILAPIAERAITRTIEAPQREKQQALQNRLMEAQIGAAQQKASTPPKGSQFFSAKGLQKIVGGDWSALADEAGNVPLELAKPVLNAQAMQGRLGVQQQQQKTAETKLDINTLEKQRNDMLKLVTEPFLDRDTKQQAMQSVQSLNEQIAKIRKPEPAEKDTLDVENDLQTIIDNSELTSNDLMQIADDVKKSARGQLVVNGKKVSFEEYGKHLEKNYGFSPTTINHLLQRFTTDPLGGM